MTESFDRVKEFSKKYTIFIVAGLLLAVGLLSTVIANGKSSSDSTQNDSGVSSSGLSSDATSSTYTTSIPTSVVVDAFSSGLGVNISQNDPSRGITFPDVSNSVDIWSAPYVTLLLYPDADSLAADSSNFTQDYQNLNSSRNWQSCLNVIAVFPASMQNQVNNVFNTWCSTNNADQTTDTPTPISNTWYPAGYSEVIPGFAFKPLPVNTYTCDAGTICLEAYAVSKNACTDSMYAEVNFLDSSGNIVDYGNDLTGVVPAKTPILLTFTTTNSAAFNYKVTKVDCNQR